MNTLIGRRSVVPVALVAFVLLVGLVQQRPASGAHVNGNPHQHSAGLSNVVAHGLEAEIPNVNMTLVAADTAINGQINQTLWGNSGSPCNLWVEAGLYNGSVAGNTPAYQYYVARNSTAGYAEYADGNAPVDGQLHVYTILYTGWVLGTGNKEAYRDGDLKLNSAGYGAGMCRLATGLEIAGNTTVADGRSHADTFNNVDLWWRDTSNIWHSGWPNRYHTNTAPCQPGGLQPPNCMNSTWYSATHWADNKPCHGFAGCTAP